MSNKKALDIQATEFSLKVCTSKGKPRVWIEGARLANHGWVRGDKFEVFINPTEQTVSLIKTFVEPLGSIFGIKSTPATVSGRNRNDKAIPIIDITGNKIAFLSEFEKISLVITDRNITIKPIS